MLFSSNENGARSSLAPFSFVRFFSIVLLIVAFRLSVVPVVVPVALSVVLSVVPG